MSSCQLSVLSLAKITPLSSDGHGMRVPANDCKQSFNGNFMTMITYIIAITKRNKGQRCKIGRCSLFSGLIFRYIFCYKRYTIEMLQTILQPYKFDQKAFIFIRQQYVRCIWFSRRSSVLSSDGIMSIQNASMHLIIKLLIWHSRYNGCPHLLGTRTRVVIYYTVVW